MMDLTTEYSELSAHLVARGCRILIQSTLLIALGLTACGFLRSRSAALRSSILRATLLAVLVCPLVGSVGVLGRVDVPIPHSIPIVSEQASSSVQPFVNGEPRESSPSIIAKDIAPAMSQAPPPRASVSRSTLYSILSVCWILGTVLLLLRLGLCHLRTRRLRDSSSPAAEHLIDACDAMAERMGIKPPTVVMSPRVGSPLLMGILRPVILLPTACQDMANAQVFAHELAHLCRRDCLWNMLCRLVTSLCFCQPLAWKLAACMAQTNEEACDDFVLSYTGERRTYARRLVEMAETLGYGSSAGLGVGVVTLRSSLGRRVQRVLSPSANRTIRTRRSEMLSVALLGVVAVLLVGLLRIHPAVSAEGREHFGDGPVSTEAIAQDIMPLVEALASLDWEQREAAAIALAQTPGNKAVAIPALADALADEQWQVRKAAAVALTTTGRTGRNAVAALIVALNDEEWQVRRPAAEALAVMGPASEPAVPALSNAVGDEEWQVRRAAASALVAIGPASRPSIPQLLRGLGDEQWHVRESAALALGAIGPDAAGAIPTLIQRLEDPEMQVRRAAASALENIAAGDKAAIPEIIGALLDTEWKRRQATAQSLERLL